jgi:hypothetical protein
MAILALKIAIYQNTCWSPFTKYIIQIKLQQNYNFTCSLIYNIQIKLHKVYINIFIKIQSIKKNSFQPTSLQIE